MKNHIKYIAVLDFEATCDNKDSDSGWDQSTPEIIEFPVALVCIETAQVIDIFHYFVQPTVQPTLTPFCTELTSIRQDQLDGQPTITEVLSLFCQWINTHKLTPENCCVLTCGDWDLRRMWSKQVSICSGLVTPPLFKQWINIKKVFLSEMGIKPTGMLSMLQHLNLEHIGRHHLGLDDVKNIARLVLRMLERGVSFSPTWGDVERAQEHKLYMKKSLKKQRAIESVEQTLARLPESTSMEIRQQKVQQLNTWRADLSRLQAQRKVFSVS